MNKNDALVYFTIILETVVTSVKAVEQRTSEEIAAIESYEKDVKSKDEYFDIEKRKITGIVDPYERKETQTHPSNTLVKYTQLCFGVEVLIILFTPVIAAATLRYIMAKYYELQCPKKAYQDDRRRGIFFEPSPHLPLHYLQQTKLEAKVKRQSRQTLSWYSKSWVLKTNELIDEVGGFSLYSNKHDPDQKTYLLKENRWKIVKTAVRVGGLYRQLMKKRNKDKSLPKISKPKRSKSVLLKMIHNSTAETSCEK